MLRRTYIYHGSATQLDLALYQGKLVCHFQITVTALLLQSRRTNVWCETALVITFALLIKYHQPGIGITLL